MNYFSWEVMVNILILGIGLIFSLRKVFFSILKKNYCDHDKCYHSHGMDHTLCGTCRDFRQDKASHGKQIVYNVIDTSRIRIVKKKI